MAPKKTATNPMKTFPEVDEVIEDEVIDVRRLTNSVSCCLKFHLCDPCPVSPGSCDGSAKTLGSEQAEAILSL